MSTLFWALWRRLYGEGTFKKYVSRTIQTVVAVLMLAFQLSAPFDWTSWGIALIVAVWVVIEYWSRAIGEILDAGLNPCQGRKNYDRWFRVVCNWITAFINLFLPKGKKIHKYYGVYDWIYSGMRNLIGVLPAMIIYPSCLWWVLVLCMYPIYRFCYWLFEKMPSMYTNEVLKKLTLNEPKNVAEVLHGATFGLIVGLV